jgi:hypothetical protein
MAVLDVLPEVIGPVKLLGEVALLVLVYLGEMYGPGIPILMGGVPDTLADEGA